MHSRKYTITQLKELLWSRKIDPLRWITSFPRTADTKLPDCEDCIRFRNNSCAGGKDPVECFLAEQQPKKPVFARNN